MVGHQSGRLKWMFFGLCYIQCCSWFVSEYCTITHYVGVTGSLSCDVSEALLVCYPSPMTNILPIWWNVWWRNLYDLVLVCWPLAYLRLWHSTLMIAAVILVTVMSWCFTLIVSGWNTFCWCRAKLEYFWLVVAFWFHGTITTRVVSVWHSELMVAVQKHCSFISAMKLEQKYWANMIVSSV